MDSWRLKWPNVDISKSRKESIIGTYHGELMSALRDGGSDIYHQLSDDVSHRLDNPSCADHTLSRHDMVSNQKPWAYSVNTSSSELSTYWRIFQIIRFEKTLEWFDAVWVDMGWHGLTPCSTVPFVDLSAKQDDDWLRHGCETKHPQTWNLESSQ